MIANSNQETEVYELPRLKTFLVVILIAGPIAAVFSCYVPTLIKWLSRVFHYQDSLEKKKLYPIAVTALSAYFFLLIMSIVPILSSTTAIINCSDPTDASLMYGIVTLAFVDTFACSGEDQVKNLLGIQYCITVIYLFIVTSSLRGVPKTERD